MQKFVDLATGVDYRRVVTAAECVTDLGQAQVGEFLGKRHSDLSWTGDLSIAPLGVQIRNAHLEVLSDGPLDVLHRNLAFLKDEQVFERVAGQFDIDGAAGEAGAGNDAVQSALELSDVGGTQNVGQPQIGGQSLIVGHLVCDVI